MGLFRKVGRQVEQFRQTAKQTAEENAGYRCRECGSRFHTHHDECPECGAEAVTSTNDEE